MERILGLDVGNKTIGVAVSDPLGITAQGVEVVRRSQGAADIARIEQIAADFEARTVVVGLPLNMNGTKGPQALVAEKFGRSLEQRGFTVVYVDERLTTKAAERTLVAADLRRKRRKTLVDKLAAQLILQIYLDRRRLQEER